MAPGHPVRCHQNAFARLQVGDEGDDMIRLSARGFMLRNREEIAVSPEPLGDMVGVLTAGMGALAEHDGADAGRGIRPRGRAAD